MDFRHNFATENNNKCLAYGENKNYLSLGISIKYNANLLKAHQL